MFRGGGGKPLFFLDIRESSWTKINLTVPNAKSSSLLYKAGECEEEVRNVHIQEPTLKKKPKTKIMTSIIEVYISHSKGCDFVNRLFSPWLMLLVYVLKCAVIFVFIFLYSWYIRKLFIFTFLCVWHLLPKNHLYWCFHLRKKNHLISFSWQLLLSAKRIWIKKLVHFSFLWQFFFNCCIVSVWALICSHLLQSCLTSSLFEYTQCFNIINLEEKIV